ncbi:MAG: metal-sulfur cluster assembly factor [Sterolibacterium sp.]|nr:metal-sulfur cluster assembly factor [Sterolibacterium sp.]
MTETTTAAPSNGTLDLDGLVEALRAVIDPEVGMNIVDLGLIYRIVVTDDESALEIEMTMTSPACPMSESIVEDVEIVLRDQLPEEVLRNVKLVWDPPWSPSMMSPDARAHYGW